MRMRGNDVILEHILDTPGWDAALRRLLAPHDVFFVALHCPLTELQRREVARGDRPPGSARRDFETIHAGRRYDLELQSGTGIDANVARLLEVWCSGRRVSEFAIPQAD